VAPTAPLLIGARAVQGVGGALMYPQVLAIIRVTFSGADLNRALGIFGAGGAAASGRHQLSAGSACTGGNSRPRS
jgi:MFS family permease